jgi:hypothetical protein
MMSQRYSRVVHKEVLKIQRKRLASLSNKIESQTLHFCLSVDLVLMVSISTPFCSSFHREICWLVMSLLTAHSLISEDRKITVYDP